MSVQKRRASTDGAGKIAEPSGDKARILESADTNAEIILLIDKMDALVIEFDIDNHLGVKLCIFGDGANEKPFAKGHRCVQF